MDVLEDINEETDEIPTCSAEASFISNPDTDSPIVQTENPPGLLSSEETDMENSDAGDMIYYVDLNSEYSNVGEDKIKEFVHRTSISKVKHGWSQEETMEKIRTFYDVLHNECIPHKKLVGCYKIYQNSRIPRTSTLQSLLW